MSTWPREVRAAHYQKNKVRIAAQRRAERIKRRFGLTVDEYDAYMAKPCAICGDPSKHLDHDHATGRIRSALCQRCNQGLGLFRDRPELLRAAATYLGSEM